MVDEALPSLVLPARQPHPLPLPTQTPATAAHTPCLCTCWSQPTPARCHLLAEAFLASPLSPHLLQADCIYLWAPCGHSTWYRAKNPACRRPSTRDSCVLLTFPQGLPRSHRKGFVGLLRVKWSLLFFSIFNICKVSLPADLHFSLSTLSLVVWVAVMIGLSLL